MTIDASCPNCGTVFTVRRELIGKRTKCTRCGSPFTITEPTMSPASAPSQFAGSAAQPADSPFSDSPSLFSAAPATASDFQRQTARNDAGGHVSFDEKSGSGRNGARPGFPAMRIVAKAYEVMAFVVLAVDVLLLIGFLIAVVRQPSSIVAAFFVWGVSFLWAMATALLLFFVSQVIRLCLQIEQNTWETSQAVTRLADHLCSIETEP